MWKIFAVTALVLFISGCRSNPNNYLAPSDLVRSLAKRGIRIESVNPLDPKPLGANDALEIKVAGSGLGIYKYDRDLEMSRKRLEKIEKSKRVYFNGIPFPIYEVSGSFVIVGLDKNREKHRILEVLRDFR